MKLSIRQALGSDLVLKLSKFTIAWKQLPIEAYNLICAQKRLLLKPSIWPAPGSNVPLTLPYSTSVWKLFPEAVEFSGSSKFHCVVFLSFRSAQTCAAISARSNVHVLAYLEAFNLTPVVLGSDLRSINTIERPSQHSTLQLGLGRSFPHPTLSDYEQPLLPWMRMMNRRRRRSKFPKCTGMSSPFRI